MSKVAGIDWSHMHLIEENVPAGKTVWTGYVDKYITAPKEEGTYTLYEQSDDRNFHVRFVWIKD